MRKIHLNKVDKLSHLHKLEENTILDVMQYYLENKAYYPKTHQWFYVGTSTKLLYQAEQIVETILAHRSKNDRFDLRLIWDRKLSGNQFWVRAGTKFKFLKM